MTRFTRLALALPAILGLAPGTLPQDPFPVASPESQGIDPHALTELATRVGRLAEAGKVVGAELLVIKNRRTVLHEAFGWRDREAKTRMEKNTIFNIRSMSKPLTGAAIQILADDGELALDDPVATYLPGFDNDKSREITIAQILTHRSGLPLSILQGMNQYPDLQSMAHAVGERGPQFPTESKFWYSDSGTDVLGAVVEKVGGCRLDEFVRDRLIEPLGMSDTLHVTDMTDPRCARLASLYMGLPGSWSCGWRPTDQPFYPYPWGSQSLYSTPRDYARFLAMWMDGGLVRESGRERRVLSTAAVERTLKPVSRMSQLGSDTPAPSDMKGMARFYGQMAIVFRPEAAPQDGKPFAFGHSGSDGTWSWAWPEHDLMVLYFTQSRGQASGLLVERMVDRLLLRPDAYADAPEFPTELRDYLGSYVANFGPYRNTTFVVVDRDGALALELPQAAVTPLIAADDGRWTLQIEPRAAVSFVRDDTGAVTAMKLHDPGGTVEMPRGEVHPEPAEPALDPDAVQKYLGFYRDEEAGRDVEFVLRDDRLAVLVPGVPVPIEFRGPDENGRWQLASNPAVSIDFQEDAEGRVVSYTVHHPGGTTVRKRVQGP